VRACWRGGWQRYDPVLAWAQRRLGAEAAVSESIFGAPQSDAFRAALRAALEAKDEWELAALYALAQAGKSTLLALAAAEGAQDEDDDAHLQAEAEAEAEAPPRAERALRLFRLDEEFQIAQWGLVEGGHDVDEAALRAKTSAALLLLRLLLHRHHRHRP